MSTGWAPADRARAAQWYRAAAEAGDVRAMGNYAWCCEIGSESPGPGDGRPLVPRAAAERGNPRGMCCLGWCERYGTGVPRDKGARRCALVPCAAALGYARPSATWACLERARGQRPMCRGRWPSTVPPRSRTMPRQCCLGFATTWGSAWSRTSEEAVRWYRAAAELGLSPCHAGAGVCCGDRHRRAQDPAAAVEWYRRAAELEDVPAMCNLGWCYEFGPACPRTDAQAVAWYEKAAKQNYPRAMTNLGGVL